MRRLTVAAWDDVSSPQRLIALYDDLDRALLDASSDAETIATVAKLAVSSVPGAQQASISEGQQGRFRTRTSTGDMATIGDSIQYELGSGPCVDAMIADTVFRSGDIATDTRWLEFGRRAHAATGATSMLSLRIFIEGDDRIAGLNMYSAAADAFDDADQAIATVLATHAAVVLIASAARDKVANLHRALDSSRSIGMAIGVLMASHKLQTDDAFTLLRIASQNSNRKLTDIAADVITTGILEIPTPKHASG